MSDCDCVLCKMGNWHLPGQEVAGVEGELELEVDDDTLAILSVAGMLLNKGLTVEDLIKRLLTEPA